jgi:hypothetical protein
MVGALPQGRWSGGASGSLDRRSAPEVQWQPCHVWESRGRRLAAKVHRGRNLTPGHSGDWPGGSLGAAKRLEGGIALGRSLAARTPVSATGPFQVRHSA